MYLSLAGETDPSGAIHTHGNAASSRDCAVMGSAVEPAPGLHHTLTLYKIRARLKCDDVYERL
jgi:hypothetical protein